SLSLCRNRHGVYGRIGRIVLDVIRGFFGRVRSVFPKSVELGFGIAVVIFSLRLGRCDKDAGVFWNQLGVEQFVDLLAHLFALAAVLFLGRQLVILTLQCLILTAIDGRAQPVIGLVFPTDAVVWWFAVLLSRFGQIIARLVLVAFRFDRIP